MSPISILTGTEMYMLIDGRRINVVILTRNKRS